MPRFRVQVTGVASVWREEIVDAATATEAIEIAEGRAKADRAYGDGPTQWELNGLLEADPVTHPEIANFCRIEMTRVDCGECGSEVLGARCEQCAEDEDDDGSMLFDLELGRFVREGEP